MALKKKSTNPTPDTKGAETEDEQVLNEAEKKAIEEADSTREEEGANTERMRRATAMLSQRFNLDEGYSVNGFKDGGKKMTVQMSNSDFVITIDIKNTEKFGLETFVEE